MIKHTSKQNINFLWGLTLRESIMASLFGVMVAMSKFLIRFPLKIPGHTGIVWMALLTICCLQSKKGRAGALAGFIAGALATFLFPGKDGFLTFFKYFLPALSLDLLINYIPFARQKWYLVSLANMISLAIKLSIDILSGLLLKIPIKPLLFGLKISLVNHLIFGIVGGAIGYFIYVRLMQKH